MSEENGEIPPLRERSKTPPKPPPKKRKSEKNLVMSLKVPPKKPTAPRPVTAKDGPPSFSPRTSGPLTSRAASSGSSLVPTPPPRSQSPQLERQGSQKFRSGPLKAEKTLLPSNKSFSSSVSRRSVNRSPSKSPSKSPKSPSKSPKSPVRTPCPNQSPPSSPTSSLLPPPSSEAVSSATARSPSPSTTRFKEEEEETEEAKAEKMSRMRHRAAMEILTSEESYLTSIMLVRELYLKHFEETSEETGSKLLMTKGEMASVFGPLDIIINYAKALYAQLRTSISPDASEGANLQLSSVFTSFVAFLKVYKQYTDNYDNSMKELSRLAGERPPLKKYLNTAQNKPESKGLSLFDYLIMPVQRVPRYCMLIREVIKHTPHDSSDLKALEVAFEKIQNLAAEINESKRRMEQQIDFIKVQNRLGLTCSWPLVPTRVYTQEFENVIVSDPPTLDPFFSTLILFNDILLLCSVEKNGSLSLSRSYDLRGTKWEKLDFSEIPEKVFGLRQKAAKKGGGANRGTAPAPLKRRKSLSKLSQALLHSSAKDLNNLAGKSQTSSGTLGPGAIRLKLAFERPFILVFDNEEVLEKFSGPFKKSCDYCDSLTLRVVEPTSLDYRARQSFSDGNFKHKGSTHQRAFFANDFLDWVVEIEGVGRERAGEIAEGLVNEGVVKSVDGKKSVIPFPDKQVPCRFIWRDYEQRLLLLKEISKNLASFVLHIVGLSSSKPFSSVKKLLSSIMESKEKDKEKEKEKEKDKGGEERMGLWTFGVGDENVYRYWLFEKRLAMDPLTPGARFHVDSVTCWVTYGGSEYYLGGGSECVELLAESHLLGEGSMAALKKWLKKK